MKPIFALIALALASCMADSTPATRPGSSTAQVQQKKIDEEDKPPFIGMTKAQALARYGNPKTQTVTDEGERWTYVLNFGEFIGKHMIPFFVSTEQLRMGVLLFGPDGRVKKFNWDVPEQ